jgi:hypothetical protein
MLRNRSYIDESEELTEEAKFPIGMKFIRSTGRQKNGVETIEDIYTTTNSKGKVVRVVYVVSHQYGGQKVIDYEVPASTIARAKKVQ